MTRPTATTRTSTSSEASRSLQRSGGVDRGNAVGAASISGSGTAYRIRTDDLRLERAVSWASRRMRHGRARRGTAGPGGILSARRRSPGGGAGGVLRPGITPDAPNIICRTVIDDAGGGGAAPAAYRGFLFSDLRGFTAFAERHGNTAAAALVDRFLQVARTSISSHHGAEVKTEGDAIHAVFPSASGAVLCGLEIVDAAARLSEQEPDRPLRVGVGVHAGEAVETAEGYIG